MKLFLLPLQPHLIPFRLTDFIVYHTLAVANGRFFFGHLLELAQLFNPPVFQLLLTHGPQWNLLFYLLQ
ncbi:hypothetical protein D3C80_1697260 [compost metagenome]